MVDNRWLSAICYPLSADRYPLSADRRPVWVSELVDR